MAHNNFTENQKNDETESIDSAFLNAFLEHADALLVILNGEGRICRFNKACEVLSGYSSEEVIGKYPWDTVLPPEDADRIREEAFDALVNNPQLLKGQYSNYWQSKNGQRYLIDWKNTLLLDENEKVKYLISSGIDVTEHERVQADLQQALGEVVGQEQRNRVILSTTMDGYALADMRGRFLDANDAFIDLLGYSREELLSIGVPDIEAAMNPEEVKARFQKIVEQGHDRFETRQRCKDGSVIDVEVSSSIAEIGGETYVFAFERDITARKQAEQELIASKEAAEQFARRNEKILETTLDGFMMTDPQGRVVDVNPAYTEILGYSREEFLSMRISDYEVVDRQQDVIERIGRIRKNGYERFESIQRHKDGRPIDVEVSATMSQFSEGEFAFAFVRDISERRHAERELVLAKEMAEKASHAKSEFLSRMSHELRTPMNAILGFSQLLELESLNSKQRGFLDEITQASHHLLNLINELLDLSRIESGKLVTEIEPVDLKIELDQALSIVQPQIAEKHLTVKQNCDNYLIYADEMRLKQVLLNLLDNAIKYNHPNGQISIKCEIQPEHKLRISVSDSGDGISEQDQAKLFTPFERLDADYRGIEGTGIGLVLCRYMIEEMGGRIGINSTPGSGSTFWIELPLVEMS